MLNLNVIPSPPGNCPPLSTRALLGKICSSDEVPLTKKERTGGEALFDSMEMMLAGNDIVISPVTRTIQLFSSAPLNTPFIVSINATAIGIALSRAPEDAARPAVVGAAGVTWGGGANGPVVLRLGRAGGVEFSSNADCLVLVEGAELAFGGCFWAGGASG